MMCNIHWFDDSCFENTFALKFCVATFNTYRSEAVTVWTSGIYKFKNNHGKLQFLKKNKYLFVTFQTRLWVKL